MGDGSAIEWTDATWNPTVGCTKVSPGCDNCYAETFVGRFAGSKGFPLPFDQMLLRGERFLSLPSRWKEPRRVFVNSLSDLFHEDVPDEFLCRVFDVMLNHPRHTFQVLTKRHARMRSFVTRYFTGGFATHPLDTHPLVFTPDRMPPNIWLGVSVEDQKWANIRIPALLDTPAAVRWISAEPLLGHVDITGWAPEEDDTRWLDWVVVGGESGPRARPMDPEWAESLLDQCGVLGVPFLFKQWGNHDATGRNVGKKAAGRELRGQHWDGYPPDGYPSRLLARPIEELIEASSLGTPEAKAARESADPALVERVMERVRELSTQRDQAGFGA